jgi:hypothetical protein
LPAADGIEAESYGNWILTPDCGVYQACVCETEGLVLTPLSRDRHGVSCVEVFEAREHYGVLRWQVFDPRESADGNFGRPNSGSTGSITVLGQLGNKQMNFPGTSQLSRQ